MSKIKKSVNGYLMKLNNINRFIFVGLFMLIQILVIVLLVFFLQEAYTHIYMILNILSIIAVLIIINGNSNQSYKIAWIIPILVVPIFGGLFYLMFGGNKLSDRERRKMQNVGERMSSVLSNDDNMLSELKEEDIVAYHQSYYISNHAYCPLYKNTDVTFLPIGEVKFEYLKQELKKAKKFIFLEYFIIAEGKMWDEILEILEQKVDEGVDVRVMYDDLGCSMTLPYQYEKKLQKMGIRCCVFNPFIPVLSLRWNNRDHRKIAVIDGNVAFTGGINLADEYINEYEKHGHWKDCSIMLKGEAVWGFTVMFLSMWDYVANCKTDMEKYRPTEKILSKGYVQPFTDSPLDNEPVGETIYLNLISQAQKYVYINTPYLIIDNEMLVALCNAAKSGVDVRIVTPHIADKIYVHAVTRAYYQVLIESGVKIYEYTPGFIHAKTFVVDDKYAVVGTVNLDYRSLYLHFECGAWMYNVSCIKDIYNDYLKTLEICELMTLEKIKSLSLIKRLTRSILRVFAPLM